jgi:hypothetical protein
MGNGKKVTDRQAFFANFATRQSKPLFCTSQLYSNRSLKSPHSITKKNSSEFANCYRKPANSQQSAEPNRTVILSARPITAKKYHTPRPAVDASIPSTQFSGDRLKCVGLDLRWRLL